MSAPTGKSAAFTRQAPPRWPLSNVTPPLAAIPTTPGCVRAHLQTVLTCWRLHQVIEDAVTIASELTANAVNASKGEAGQLIRIQGRIPVIRVWLLCNRSTLRLEVWDQAPGVPVCRHPATFEEAGRGLALVEALSLRWDWQSAPFPLSKIVWAEVGL